MRTLTFVSLLTALLAGSAFAGSLDVAKKHLAEGRFPAARDAAAAIAERDAAFARAQYLVGEISLLLGENTRAVEAYRKALQAKPDSATLLTGLGRALVADDEPAAAIPVLKKAVAKDPKSGRAHCFLGIATRQDSFGERGGKQIRKGVKLAPDDPIVIRAAVLYWLDENEVEHAAKAADAFRTKNPRHPMGPFLGALVHERARKFDKAIESYQAAIKLDDRFLDAHKNLAILCITQNPMYRDKKRTELALEHFARYRELGGKDAKVIQVHETLKKFLPQITGRR